MVSFKQTFDFFSSGWFFLHLIPNKRPTLKWYWRNGVLFCSSKVTRSFTRSSSPPPSSIITASPSSPPIGCRWVTAWARSTVERAACSHTPSARSSFSIPSRTAPRRFFPRRTYHHKDMTMLTTDARTRSSNEKVGRRKIARREMMELRRNCEWGVSRSREKTGEQCGNRKRVLRPRTQKCRFADFGSFSSASVDPIWRKRLQIQRFTSDSPSLHSSSRFAKTFEGLVGQKSFKIRTTFSDLELGEITEMLVNWKGICEG